MIKRIVATIVIFLAAIGQSHAIPEWHGKQLVEECAAGGGAGLDYFKDSHSDNCPDLMEGRKPEYETDEMQRKMTGSCECPGENLCWSPVDSKCMDIKDWCMESEYANCSKQ